MLISVENLLILVAESIEYSEPINPGDLLEDIDGWDSLGVLSVIAMLDELNIKVDLQELQRIRSVNEFLQLCGFNNDK